jgi:hypothetical protein
MTETDDDAVAHRIAERGRDALLERLRPAFEEAAQAHADLIRIDSNQLEEMLQRAADRADGLQWRRALASVATEELGIGLGEALSHAAVARAQTILGVPSYEDSLAELLPGRARVAAEDASEAEVVPEGAQEHADAEAVSEEAWELAVAEAEADVEEAEHEQVEARRADSDDAAEELPPATDATRLRVNATHVSGIASLSPDETGLELQLSDDGLDISRDDGVLGRLYWHEIEAIEVPAPRGRRRRRKHDAQLLIKTAQGTATFSIPALTPDEFRKLLGPVVERNRPEG